MPRWYVLHRELSCSLPRRVSVSCECSLALRPHTSPSIGISNTLCAFLCFCIASFQAKLALPRSCAAMDNGTRPHFALMVRFAELILCLNLTWRARSDCHSDQLLNVAYSREMVRSKICRLDCTCTYMHAFMHVQIHSGNPFLFILFLMSRTPFRKFANNYCLCFALLLPGGSLCRVQVRNLLRGRLLRYCCLHLLRWTMDGCRGRRGTAS